MRKKNHEKQREFFVWHCTRNPSVVNLIFQLRSKNDETKAVIEIHEIIKKGQKRDRLEHLQEGKKKIEEEIERLAADLVESKK